MQTWQSATLLILLFASVGVASLVLSWRLIKQTKAFVSRAVRTEGTVAEVLSRREQDSQGKWATYYSAVVSYQDATGKTFTYSSGGRTTWKPKLDRKVTILLDPKNPEIVRSNNLFALWGIPAIVGVIGLSLLWAAFAVFRLL